MDPRIVQKKLEILEQKEIVESRQIGGWEARTADYRAPGDYMFDGDWVKADGQSLWPAGKTVFLRFELNIPDDTPDDCLFLRVDAEGIEGLLSMGGVPYAGIDSEHPNVMIAARGMQEAEIEFVSLLRSLCEPGLKEEFSRVKQIRLVEIDPRVKEARYDFAFVRDTAGALPDSGRRSLILKALEDAMLAVDVTLEGDAFIAELSAARNLLWDRISAIPLDPAAFRVFLTGHSHIDVAWLWPLKETVRKCGRTFATACRLMERFPDYHFSCSQPQLYAYTREHFPVLYTEIRNWVKSGRWATTGGMWVESDCNVTGGESLIRQVLHGLRFFREEFGTRPVSCWLPDVFGYPGSLPQILSSCGIMNFFTIKLHWQARNRFPNHLFWWEGIDGTRILSHIPDLERRYSGWVSPSELVAAERNFLQKGLHDAVLIPFGHGDGGGGPTEKMLEYTARAMSFPGLPSCKQAAEEAYFDEVHDKKPELPVWQGELYLETHRGTLTSQAKTKQLNRRCEGLLRDSEILGWMAHTAGNPVDLSGLDEAWKKLLLHQFHDDLPGSSIREVYEDAERDYKRIEAVCGVTIQTVSASILQKAPAADVTVFNTLSWERCDPAVVRIPKKRLPDAADVIHLVDPGGNRIPAQKVYESEDSAEYVFLPRSIPAVGYCCFRIAENGGARNDSDSGLLAQTDRLENSLFRVQLNEAGEITSLFDRTAGREVTSPGQTVNRLQLFQDGPEKESAWNVHDTFSRREYSFEGKSQVSVLEKGPVRAAIRIERQFRESRIVQDIVLHANFSRIDFKTRAFWQERQVLLKTAFPLDIRSDFATFEVQFGAVRRPTHRNTSWDQVKFEVAGHRWADLSEAGFGVSLLNDSKYGYDALGNVLRLSLLRGSEYPDPDADRGEHTFTYSLYPHSGDWSVAETVNRARELNALLHCASTNAGTNVLPESRSFLTVDGPAILETLKPADDGNGWIMRLYEANGGRGEVTVRFTQVLKSVVECNSVEEEGDTVSGGGEFFTFPIRPFQIRSFRVVD